MYIQCEVNVINHKRHTRGRKSKVPLDIFICCHSNETTRDTTELLTEQLKQIRFYDCYHDNQLLFNFIVIEQVACYKSLIHKRIHINTYTYIHTHTRRHTCPAALEKV